MTKQRTRDYSQILIFAAILVTVARYVGAFLASDLGQIEGAASTVMTVLMAVTGVGMGLLDVLGSAYVFDGWRRNLPAKDKGWSNRFRVQTAFVVALFVSGIGILVPFTVSRVVQESMKTIFDPAPVALWVWALLVNVAPYLLLGGVVTSQTGVVGIAHDAAHQSASETHQSHDAAHDAKPSAAWPRNCRKCGASLASASEAGTHARWHCPHRGNGYHKESAKEVVNAMG